MKILFIACYSPLINNSASIETLMYLNNLCNKDNNEVHLLTVDFPKNSIYYDEEILALLDKKVHIHKISGGKIFNKIMPKKLSKISEEVPFKDKKYYKKKLEILRAFKKKFIFPDMYYKWSFKASRYGINLTKREKFDVIFSMHEPPSSHLCAFRIKKAFKEIPWVLYWSDPWTKDLSREKTGALRKWVEKRQEKEVVSNGDRHIFVTEENRDDFIKEYGILKEKCFIITRGYDGNLYNEIEKEKIPKLLNKKKINLVYTGEIFSKLRDLNPFFEALEKLQREEYEFLNRFNILFFGNIDNKELQEKLNRFSSVSFNPRVDYKTALKYMIHSDGLLIWGNRKSKQIPAKIYDYFGTKNPIISILGDEEDPLKSKVCDSEKCIVVNNNKDEIIDSFKKLEVLIRENKCFYEEKEYEWKNICNRLNSILKF